MTVERELLRGAARRVADEQFTLDDLRKLRSADSAEPLRATWRRFGELGWAGVLVPEAHGGSAGRLADVAVVLEELGRSLAISPMVAGVVAATVLASVVEDRPVVSPLLAALARGEACVVLADQDGTVTATAAGGEWTLDGGSGHVVFGPVADAFLVAAVVPGDTEPSLFLVDNAAAGLVRRDGVLIDSQPVSAVIFDGVAVPEAARLADGAHAGALLERALKLGAVARAAWMAGALRRALDVTVDYLKTREQFGVRIGAFQALQHRVARLHCDAVLATAVVARTADAIDEGDARADRLVHACQAHVSQTYLRIAEEGVQLHGGLGMTDEAEIGFHLKAARVAEHDFGDVRHHRARYAALAGY